MDLNAGGHLTMVQSQPFWKWFKATTYKVHSETHLIDYEEVRRQALTHHPKMIIAGGSAYSRALISHGFEKLQMKSVQFLWWIWRILQGFVAGEVFPSPLSHAHVVTTTTHKTLRGPREE